MDTANQSTFYSIWVLHSLRMWDRKKILDVFFLIFIRQQFTKVHSNLIISSFIQTHLQNNEWMPFTYPYLSDYASLESVKETIN